MLDEAGDADGDGDAGRGVGTAVVGERQHEYMRLEGTPVLFPFKPYDCQVDYMAKLIKALNERQNAMLESPTGTGKTLCLLCATLAWQQAYVKTIQSTHVREATSATPTGLLQQDAYEDVEGRKPVIIYASRTHTQIGQTVKELKATAYNPEICVLGSRDQMCINSAVRQQPSNAAKTYLCRKKVKDHECGFHFNLDTVRPKEGEIMDIEDLVKFGKENSVCPYYLTRKSMRSADIIFAPYNYVVDARLRSLQKIPLQNAIVIIDEAHNIESVCEDASSFSLSTKDISGFIHNCDQLLAADPADLGEELREDDILQLKRLFLKMEDKLGQIQVKKGETFCEPGGYIYSFLKQCGIHQDSFSAYIRTLEIAVTAVTGLGESVKCFLDKMQDIMELLFGGKLSPQELKDMYFVNVQEVKPARNKHHDANTDETGKVINLWCFSPASAMQKMMEEGVRNLILTSGTLSPMDVLATELKLNFPITLENPHVITGKQVWAGIVTNYSLYGKRPQKSGDVSIAGKGGANDAATIGKIADVQLSSAFKNRENVQYHLALGNLIVNVCQIVPKGVLVFFPSYRVMAICIKTWKTARTNKRTIWERISDYKTALEEPRRKDEFVMAMDQFYEEIRKPHSSAIFFAVARGKVSEGLDFANDNGRAVIITGLPFPASMDPKVILKQKYINRPRPAAAKGSSSKEKRISGKQWYFTQATRAVNQAIGRVIRHRLDYGAIILADARFASMKGSLPRWLRGYVNEYRDFLQAFDSIKTFFGAPKNAAYLLNETNSRAENASRSHVAKRDIEYEEEYDSMDKARLQVEPTAHAVVGSSSLTSFSTSKPTKVNVLTAEKEFRQSGDAQTAVDGPSSLLLARSNSVSGKRRAPSMTLASEHDPPQAPSTSTVTVSVDLPAAAKNTSSTNVPLLSSDAVKKAKRRDLFVSAQKLKNSATTSSKDASNYLQQFLKQLKAELSSTEYTQTLSVLRDFHKAAKSQSISGHLEVLVNGFHEIFSGKRYLMFSFEMCLPPKFRDQFKLLVKKKLAKSSS